jgi:nucleolar MIF4G domain-containing protein 1
LGLSVLKCLNVPYLQAKTKAFVEIMLITAILGCRGSEDSEKSISTIFMSVREVPELARGLQWFLRKVVRKTDLAGGKAETLFVKEACKTANATLQKALSAAEDLLE